MLQYTHHALCRRCQSSLRISKRLSHRYNSNLCSKFYPKMCSILWNQWVGWSYQVPLCCNLSKWILCWWFNRAKYMFHFMPWRLSLSWQLYKKMRFNMSSKQLTFGDKDGDACVYRCPDTTFAQNDTNRRCVPRCNTTTWGNKITRICISNPVTQCPANTWADNFTQKC